MALCLLPLTIQNRFLDEKIKKRLIYGSPFHYLQSSGGCQYSIINNEISDTDSLEFGFPKGSN